MSKESGGSQQLIATAFDDRYLWPWACSTFSALTQSKADLSFLVANVNGLLSSKCIDLMGRVLEALGAHGSIVDVQIEVDAFERYQWNATAYARLCLLDLLDQRFLWLDGDTLLRHEWDQVFEMSGQLLADESLIACAVRDRTQTLDQMREAGTNQAYLATRGDYFNAGVFVADPQRWRASGFAEQWRELVAKQDDHGFTYLDQDILNFLLAGKVGFLPRTYNHIVSEPTIGQEKILHYAGYPKPWRLNETGRAFFMAIEVLNAARPQHQISGGGTAWQLFPSYWEEERAFERALVDRGAHDLATTLLRLRASQLMATSLKERAKLSAMRLLARQILPF